MCGAGEGHRSSCPGRRRPEGQRPAARHNVRARGRGREACTRRMERGGGGMGRGCGATLAGCPTSLSFLTTAGAASTEVTTPEALTRHPACPAPAFCTATTPAPRPPPPASHPAPPPSKSSADSQATVARQGCAGAERTFLHIALGINYVFQELCLLQGCSAKPMHCGRWRQLLGPRPGLARHPQENLHRFNLRRPCVGAARGSSKGSRRDSFVFPGV